MCGFVSLQYRKRNISYLILHKTPSHILKCVCAYDAYKINSFFFEVDARTIEACEFFTVQTMCSSKNIIIIIFVEWINLWMVGNCHNMFTYLGEMHTNMPRPVAHRLQLTEQLFACYAGNNALTISINTFDTCCFCFVTERRTTTTKFE